MNNRMKLTVLVICIFSILSGFNRKPYSNYDRTAVYYFLNGLFYEQIGSFEEGLNNFRKAYRNSGEGSVKFNTFLELQRTGETEKAIGVLRELRSEGYSLGRYGIYLYLDHIDKDENSAAENILYEMTEQLYSADDIEFANTLLVQKIKDGRYKYNNISELTETVEEMLKRELTPKYRLYFILLQIRLYAESGNIDKVRKLAETAENTPKELPYIYYRILFDVYDKLEMHEELENTRQQMRRITFEDINYYIDESEYFRGQGNYIEARNILLEGLRKYPRSSLLFELGETYLDAEDISQASIVYDRINDIFPDDPEIRMIPANELWKRGYTSKALEIFSKLQHLFPGNAELINNYAYLLAEEDKDLKKALKLSERSLKMKPGTLSYLDTKAWILYKTGRYKEAGTIMDDIFSGTDIFYHPASEELFEHFKEIKLKLNEAEVLNEMSVNTSAVIINRILNENEIILQADL